MRDAFVSTLLQIAQKDRNVCIVTGDLGFGVLRPFWDNLPEQIINAGISEQNMTGLAAGMAREGKIVFTYSIGNFPTLRCLEQIRNDCAYHNADVKIVCIGGGMVYGALGMSHHATEDIAVLRALPDVTVMAPCDRVEARLATQAIYETPGTCYLRLGRGGEKRIHSTEPVFEVGKAIKVKDGNRIAILTTGAIFEESDKARILLEAKGITPAMYTFPTVKPIDVETIKRCCECYDLIVTVEEHNLSGGFGSAVAEVMCELRDRRARLLRIGLEDLYTSVVGSQDHLRDVYGISGTKIAERIMKNV